MVDLDKECPNCGSINITINKTPYLQGVIVDGKCNDCKHEWNRDIKNNEWSMRNLYFKNGLIIMVDEEKICPECKKKMIHIPRKDTFDGPVPEEYICYECGHRENV